VSSADAPAVLRSPEGLRHRPEPKGRHPIGRAAQGSVPAIAITLILAARGFSPAIAITLILVAQGFSPAIAAFAGLKACATFESLPKNPTVKSSAQRTVWVGHGAMPSGR